MLYFFFYLPIVTFTTRPELLSWFPGSPRDTAEIPPIIPPSRLRRERKRKNNDKREKKKNRRGNQGGHPYELFLDVLIKTSYCIIGRAEVGGEGHVNKNFIMFFFFLNANDSQFWKLLADLRLQIVFKNQNIEFSGILIV